MRICSPSRFRKSIHPVRIRSNFACVECEQTFTSCAQFQIPERYHVNCYLLRRFYVDGKVVKSMQERETYVFCL